MADPLRFLLENDITGVVIWPDDKIPDPLLARLTSALAPDYRYVDCRGQGADNAGVFLRLPVSSGDAAAPNGLKLP
jgi:hypothetical protein